MNQFRCASCNQAIEIDEQAPGDITICSNCGAINDVPEEYFNSQQDEVPFEGSTEGPSPRGRSFGIPGVLFWPLIVLLACAFIYGAVRIFSQDWESQHWQQLITLVTTADASISRDDLGKAVTQYQAALDLVGSRTLASQFLQKLMEHARDAQAEAKLQLSLREKSPDTFPSLPSTLQ
jgi:hypothetical protein